MSSFKTRELIALITVLITAIICTVFVAAYLSHRDDNKSEVVTRQVGVLKLTYYSHTKAVEKFFAKNVKGFKKSEDVILWQSPNNGNTLQESYIFAQFNAKTKKQKALVRKGLKEEGYKRVREVCKTVANPKEYWSLGFCTMNPAPFNLEG